MDSCFNAIVAQKLCFLQTSKKESVQPHSFATSNLHQEMGRRKRKVVGWGGKLESVQPHSFATSSLHQKMGRRKKKVVGWEGGGKLDY